MCLSFLSVSCSHLHFSPNVCWCETPFPREQHRRGGGVAVYSLKLLPWKVIAHSHVRGQCGPLGPVTNRAAVLRCVSGVFFHKAFYKSVTAPCLPFPPCTHALLSQQAPKELLRNAEPTHKLALLATLVILFLALSSTFLARVPVACAESRLPRLGEQERRCLFGA